MPVGTRSDADRGKAAAGLSDRDRQIVVSPLFENVCGRQVNHDASGRQRQSDGAERGADTFPAFPDGLVGQADNRDGRHSVCYLYLHVDLKRIDALKRDGFRVCDCHCPPRSIVFSGGYGEVWCRFSPKLDVVN